jgi:hypothetical protein
MYFFNLFLIFELLPPLLPEPKKGKVKTGRTTSSFITNWLGHLKLVENISNRKVERDNDIEIGLEQAPFFLHLNM